MIIQERKGDLIHTYSDMGVYVHGGFPEADYAIAIDPVSAGREYVETDRPIESEEIDAEEALRIILGGEAE